MGGFSWLHPTAAAAGDPHSRSLRRPKPIFWVNLLALWAAAEHSIAQSQPGGLLYSRIPVLSGQDLGVPFFRRNITRIWYLTASPEAPARICPVIMPGRESARSASRVTRADCLLSLQDRRSGDYSLGIRVDARSGASPAARHHRCQPTPRESRYRRCPGISCSHGSKAPPLRSRDGDVPPVAQAPGSVEVCPARRARIGDDRYAMDDLAERSGVTRGDATPPASHSSVWH
jgi:hypothetical protein